MLRGWVRRTETFSNHWTLFLAGYPLWSCAASKLYISAMYIYIYIFYNCICHYISVINTLSLSLWLHDYYILLLSLIFIIVSMIAISIRTPEVGSRWSGSSGGNVQLDIPGLPARAAKLPRNLTIRRKPGTLGGAGSGSGSEVQKNVQSLAKILCLGPKNWYAWCTIWLFTIAMENHHAINR